MAKITYQDALPRRSLYADAEAKPLRRSLGSLPAPRPYAVTDNLSGADILSAARAEAADILSKARVRADILSAPRIPPADILSETSASADKMSAAFSPCSPASYADWIARLGMTEADAAALLGFTERSARRWQSGDEQAPLHVRQRLALIEALGLTAARTILSGVGDAA